MNFLNAFCMEIRNCSRLADLQAEVRAGNPNTYHFMVQAAEVDDLDTIQWGVKHCIASGVGLEAILKIAEADGCKILVKGQWQPMQPSTKVATWLKAHLKEIGQTHS